MKPPKLVEGTIEPCVTCGEPRQRWGKEFDKGHCNECLEAPHTRYPSPPEKEFPSDPGGYYSRCSHRARHYQVLLAQARLDDAPYADLKWLEEKVLTEGYTGD